MCAECHLFRYTMWLFPRTWHLFQAKTSFNSSTYVWWAGTCSILFSNSTLTQKMDSDVDVQALKQERWTDWHMDWFIHSLVRLFINWFFDWFIWLIYLIDSFIHPSIRPSVHACIHSCIHSFNHSFIHSFIHSSMKWFLALSFICSFICLFACFFACFDGPAEGWRGREIEAARQTVRELRNVANV